MAKAVAKRTVCQNNQKQIYLAHVMYTGDNDGYLTAPWKGKIPWDDLLGDYDGRSLTATDINRNSFDDDDKGRHMGYFCPADDPQRFEDKVERSYAVVRAIWDGGNSSRGPIQPGWQVTNNAKPPYSPPGDANPKSNTNASTPYGRPRQPMSAGAPSSPTA